MRPCSSFFIKYTFLPIVKFINSICQLKNFILSEITFLYVVEPKLRLQSRSEGLFQKIIVKYSLSL